MNIGTCTRLRTLLLKHAFDRNVPSVVKMTEAYIVLIGKRGKTSYDSHSGIDIIGKQALDKLINHFYSCEQ